MIEKVAETDPRPQRHAARKAEIVEVAWRLARTDGFPALSLRALAGEVGIRQPSLYAYFASKDALFDEMFAAGNRELLARIEALDLRGRPRAALGALMHEFAAFCVEDAARAQLLFQRPIPGFVPTAASYEPAERFLDRVRELLARNGVDDPADMDVFVALVAGLLDAQFSNDPGGNRWTRHLDRVIDMFFADVKRRRHAVRVDPARRSKR